MSLEQEIKLTLTSKVELDLKELDWLSSYIEQVDNQHLVSKYFDTPELEIIGQGIGLRLRNDNGKWLQTVKSTGQVVDGLHQREEWEHPLKQAQFDETLLKQTALKPIVENESLWQRIDVVFTTDFHRQAAQLKLDDETYVEMAYDYGRVFTASATSMIDEVELELKSGSIEVMKQFAELCMRKLPLQYGAESKAHKGYQLLKN
jgi:triphosphatase